jgi:hypothetical protein
MPHENLSPKGFIRLQLKNARTGEIEGDSGWNQNVITDDGFDNYIVGAVGGIAGSKQVTHLALGTQTNAPVSTQATASGEDTWAARKAPTLSLVGDGTLQATASWETNEATASNVGAIAMHDISTVNDRTACAIATFASSAKTTDQTINATYQLRFS